MATTDDLVAAITEIDKALRAFAGNGERTRVRVYETAYGHIEAVVGSDRFKGKSIGQRQKLIWEELNKSGLDRRHIGLLYGVRTLDSAEFDELMRQLHAESLESRPVYDIP